MASPVSLRQLADHVGLSPATVSLALNGKGRISDETRRKVREAAEALGYQPSAAMSAAMRSAGSRGRQAFRETLGCVSVQESLEFFERSTGRLDPALFPREISFLHAIREHSRRLGCGVDFFSLQDLPTERLIKVLQARRIERLIIIPALSHRGLKGLEEIEKLTRIFPCVFLGLPPGAWLREQTVVDLDDYSTGKLVFLEALKAGYQQMLFSRAVTALKIDGRFLSGVQHCRVRIGADVDILVPGTTEEEHSLLKQAAEDQDARLCYIGGREGLQGVARQFPDVDFSGIGWMDLNARRPEPSPASPASGVDQRREEQARAALEMCLAVPAIHKEDAHEGRLVLIEPGWVAGETLKIQERPHHGLGRCRVFSAAATERYSFLKLPTRSLQSHDVIARRGLLHYPLPPMQSGRASYHGIPFHISTHPNAPGTPQLLMLGSDQHGKPFRQSCNIQVNQQANAVYFLWAAGFCHKGQNLGTVRVIYQKGERIDLPILPRNTEHHPDAAENSRCNIQDWWPEDPPLRNDHTHPVRLFHILRQTEHFGYYYVHRWENPRTTDPITQIRIQAQPNAPGFIILCGLTAAVS